MLGRAHVDTHPKFWGCSHAAVSSSDCSCRQAAAAAAVAAAAQKSKAATRWKPVGLIS